jgi:hypothetical protein
MTARPWLPIGAFLTIAFTITAPSQGLAEKIFVTIGTTALESADNATSYEIPLQTYKDSNGKRIEIQLIDSNQPTLKPTVVIDDTNPIDSIRLKNVKIKAVDNVSGFPITMKRVFQPGPKTRNAQNQPVDVFYQTAIKGRFLQPAQAGNALTANQYLTHPTSSNPVSMGGVQHIVCSPSTITLCSEFDKASANAQWNTDANGELDNDRRLTVEIFISLSLGKYLQINQATNDPFGVKMESTGGAGVPDTCKVPNCPSYPHPTCPACTKKSELSSFCMTTYSTAHTSGCPDCMSEDGTLRPQAQAQFFVQNSWDSLSQDLAKGTGEYLAALATILKIPTDQQSQFFIFAQSQYQARFSEGNLDPQHLVAALRENLPQFVMLDTKEPRLER